MRVCILALTFFIPGIVLAADASFFGPLVPACTEGGGSVAICQACNLVQLVQNILRIMVSLGVMAAALMFAYAGFLYVTAASNHSNLESAKKIFWNVLIGLVFILASYIIVDLILKTFTGQSLNVFSNISCVSMNAVDGTFTFPVVPDATPPLSGTQGGDVAPTGAYCSGANWSPYESQIRSAVRANPNVANMSASDMADFCPNYASLSAQQKEDVAVRLFSSMARYESGCNPNASAVEPQSSFPNPDPMTGQPVTSEGFFQLSYQDEQGYKTASGVCDFNYAARDIRDPKKNIDCGVYIFSRQLSRTGSVAAPGSYWSILRSGQYSKLPQIRAAVRSVPGCM